MKEEVRKQLGKPKNDLEKDTLNYIEPLVTDMIGEDIIGKGLTHSGCLEYCFKHGKKFEIKSGSKGCARVTEWCTPQKTIRNVLLSKITSVPVSTRKSILLLPLYRKIS